MTAQAARILQEALSLSESERCSLVEELIASLHKIDPEIDDLWVREAKDRLAAYDAGEMKAIPAEQVFKEMEAL